MREVILRDDAIAIQNVVLGDDSEVGDVDQKVDHRNATHGERRCSLDRPDWIADFRQSVISIGVPNERPVLLLSTQV